MKLQDFNTPSTRLILLATVVAIVTFSAFSGVLQCGFVPLDDPYYPLCPYFANRGLDMGTFLWSFQATQESNWHPLAWISHTLDVSLYGNNPKGHHLTSLLIHISSGILCLFVFYKITQDLTASFLISLFFSIHPLRVESVAWVSERKDVLCVFFGLLSILFYLEYARKNCRKAYLFCLIAAILGLLSKAMLVTLPFLFFLLDYWPLKRFGLELPGHVVSFRKLIIEKIPFLIASACVSVITFWTAAEGKAMFLSNSLPMLLRVENAGIAYIRYLGKLFYPVSLAIMYPMRIDPSMMTKFIICAALLIAITLLFICLGRKKPFLITGWLWYLGAFFPIIGIVQIGPQAIADRFTYLPSLGILLITSIVLLDLMRRHWTAKIIGIILLSLAGLFCMAATDLQVSYWKNGFTLFAHSLEVEDSPMIRLFYGQGLEKIGQYDRAFEQFQKAYALAPKEDILLTSMAEVRIQQGQFDQVLRYLNKIDIEKKNDLDKAYLSNLYAIYYQSANQTEKALLGAQQACDLTHFENLNYIKTLAGVYEIQQDYTNAIATIDKAVSIAEKKQMQQELSTLLEFKKQLLEKQKAIPK
jgi:hypothetical protein